MAAPDRKSWSRQPNSALMVKSSAKARLRRTSRTMAEGAELSLRPSHSPSKTGVNALIRDACLRQGEDKLLRMRAECVSSAAGRHRRWSTQDHGLRRRDIARDHLPGVRGRCECLLGDLVPVRDGDSFVPHTAACAAHHGADHGCGARRVGDHAVRVSDTDSNGRTIVPRAVLTIVCSHPGDPMPAFLSGPGPHGACRASPTPAC
jgi:hypothetical protein